MRRFTQKGFTDLIPKAWRLERGKGELCLIQEDFMSLKNGLCLVASCVALLGLTIASPVTAQEFSEEEADALENNLVVLCDASFEDLEEMGIVFNETGQEYLDVACNAVLDGVDESDYSDAEFVDAIDFLTEALAAVTYEE